MNIQRTFSAGVLVLLAIFAIACSQARRSDQEITADVQAKVRADTLLANQNIAVQTSSGVVVLSGNVPSDMERMAAENDAKQVQGVKSLVNNLQVVAAAAPPPTEPAQEKPKAKTQASGAQPATQKSAAPKPAAPAAATEKSAAPKPAAPAAATVAQVTIPKGTKFSVRLIDPIDSAVNKVGDVFRATLDTPVVVEDKVVIPKQADIEGQVVDARSAGHFTGSSQIGLVLTKVTAGGKTYGLKTAAVSKQGASRGVRTAETVGGGAAVGALIGGLAGGGKGAAIGGAVGAGAGAGVQGVTKGQQVKFPSEAVLDFELQEPVTVTPTGSSRPTPEKIG
jgi:cell division septation protein DedD